MILLVLSDFHLGKGKFLKNGQLNILEDFFEDDRFEEFTNFYSSGKHYWSNVHLVLNGDILNMIQIDLDGVFTHIVDEEHSLHSLEKINDGHRVFFEALRKFLSAPNKRITYVIGNHDAAMAFEKTQERFREIVGGKVHFCFELNEDGIHIEHGHRFEVINTVPPSKYFIKGPCGKKILNLPWGSLFCISVLPVLKKDRPMIDKVRPMSAYIKWTLLHDIGFFFRMASKVIRYLVNTRFDAYVKQNRNFRTSLKILKQITIYPKYERMAKSILRSSPHTHTVIMGHTHVVEWRRYPEGKYYFNSGTWNSIPSMDAGMFEGNTNLTYIFIDLESKKKTIKNASLNVWQGNWRPYREEVGTSYLARDKK